MSEALPRLPGVLGDLAEAVDLRAALALARHRGGIPMYVPKDLPDEHELILQIGFKAAQWLADNFGGEYILVPLARDHLRQLRNQEMRRKHREQGVSGHALAREYGLTASTVWAILSEDDDADQPDLFDAA